MANNSKISIIIIFILLIILGTFTVTNSYLRKHDINYIISNNPKLQDYQGQSPKITQITGNMVNSFGVSTNEGDYLLEYNDANIIVDIKNNQVREILKIPSDLLSKINKHITIQQYINEIPLIVKITQSNLDSLNQKIAGLDSTYINNFILKYTNHMIIYDYNNDKILHTIPISNSHIVSNNLPTDLLDKLYSHQELTNYKDQDSIGILLTEQIISEYKKTYPEIFSSIKPGDILLRYSNMLIIYNYEEDKIKQILSI